MHVTLNIDISTKNVYLFPKLIRFVITVKYEFDMGLDQNLFFTAWNLSTEGELKTSVSKTS